MKKIIVGLAIASFSISAFAHRPHNHSSGRIIGSVIIGSIIAGALMTPRPAYSNSYIYCPSCAPDRPPQYYIDNMGNVYNQYGNLICAGVPIYDANGVIVGYQRGC